MNPHVLQVLRGYLRRRKAYRLGVAHVTLNPEGPGVVRMHLVPPLPQNFANPPHVLIINGSHIFPVGESWSWLLRTFMNVLKEVAVDGQQLTEDQMDALLDEVSKRMRKLFPEAPSGVVVSDLGEVMTLIERIADGETEDIPGMMSIREYASYMAAPHRMDLIIKPMKTGHRPGCNLDCLNCYAKDQRQMVVDEELSTAEWKRIIDKCWKIGVPQLTFTGGEPTLRFDLVELVSYAQRFVTRLNTNGTLITPALAEDLYAASLDAIQFTVYSYDAEIHDRLVGREGAWSMTIQGIRNAVAAGLGVSVNTPLVRANSDYVALLHELSALGVVYFSASGLIPMGGACHTLVTDEALENQQMFDVMQQAVAFCIEHDLDLAFTSPGWLTEEQLDELGLDYPACGACLSNMAVAPNGTVVPCQSWLFDEGLGNILHDPWKNIWNHSQCLQMRSVDEPQGCPLSTHGKE